MFMFMFCFSFSVLVEIVQNHWEIGNELSLEDSLTHPYSTLALGVLQNSAGFHGIPLA